MAKKETVIQFGEGGFLRGFVDYFFQKLKDKGMFDGSVVVVQPIEKGMCEMLEKQGCEYNLFLRGIDNGEVVDEHTHINVISRCVNPYTDNEAYMKLAENLSNSEVFKRADIKVWYCRNCGHLEYGDKAPDVCPVCSHPQAFFEVKAENY